MTTAEIRRKAKGIAKRHGLKEFDGGSQWCTNFMERNKLSVRAVTSTGQKLPTDWEMQMASFRDRIRPIRRRCLPKDIGNMDEVPVQFDMPGRRTVDRKGSQDIRITTTGRGVCWRAEFNTRFLGHEKTCFTVVLCVTSDGRKCTPMVIFKLINVPKQKFPEGNFAHL